MYHAVNGTSLADEPALLEYTDTTMEVTELAGIMYGSLVTKETRFDGTSHDETYPATVLSEWEQLPDNVPLKVLTEPYTPTRTFYVT